MKRRVGIVFLALLCTIVVCGSYWSLKSKVRVHPDETENLTKIEKIVGRDLDNDYPSTPREVVKFYNKIILSFYTEDYSDEQFEGLLTQARGLMDDELLANNPLDTYRSSVKDEIANYEKRDREIRQSSVRDSDDVLLKTDPNNDDELAYVTATYFVKEKKEFTRSLKSMKFSLAEGFGAYILVSIVMAIMCGFSADMSAGMFVWWIIFAALSAIISELIVGISAMHSGWFPAFATAFIFLILGMLFGFPPAQLAILVGFTSATGPAFADMAYDLKSGYIVRGIGEDVPFEMEGRRQQYIAKMVSAVIAILVVLFTYKAYFEKGMLAPVDAVYVATIDAGTNMAVAKNLITWAIPGALLQAIGGSGRQLGVLFATGLLIASPMAGITVLVGLLIRYIVVKKYGDLGQSKLYILGAGFITGAALYSFFSSTMNLGKKLNK